MSTAADARPEQTTSESSGEQWEPTAGSQVLVRRRGGLMATGAIAAAVIAAGYLWSFADTGNLWSAVIGATLGVIAVSFAIAWRDARTPLLVADETGLRVRLGSAWTGVPWEQVECVEVQARGRVRDGHVAVILPEGVDALAGATTRSRLAAWVNHMFFETPLVTPYGLSTIESTADMTTALRRLGAGRVDVIALGVDDELPEATVEVLRRPAGPTEPTVAAASTEPAINLPGAGGDPVDAIAADPAAPSRWRRLAALTSARTKAEPLAGQEPTPAAAWDAGTEAFGAAEPTEAPEPTAPISVRPAVAPLESKAARREDVTIAPGSLHPTDGGLALTPDVSDAEPAVALPEIEHLRRNADDDTDDPHSGGNVGLIIDATTDLSARAMQRVRSGRSTAGPEPEVRVVTPRTEPPGALFGKELQEARLRLGLSVDDLADRTRIRPYVIESIEADDFGPCGGDFYARGHLRQLARVLGVDVTPLIERYDANIATSPVSPREVFEVELAAGTTGMVRGGERGANWAALIGAVLVLLIIWGVARYFITDASPEAPAPTNRDGVASQGPGNPPVPPPALAKGKITAVGGESRVVVKDRFGTVVFKGVLADGESERFKGEAPLKVKAADGSVISLKTSGEPAALMSDQAGPAKDKVTEQR